MYVENVFKSDPSKLTDLLNKARCLSLGLRLMLCRMATQRRREEVAHAIGCTVMRLESIERRSLVWLDGQIVRKLASYYGIHPNDLLGSTER